MSADFQYCDVQRHNKTQPNPKPQRKNIMSKLNGKIALITGGTTGLGFAAAERFLREGAEVIITGRRQAELDSAVKRLGGNVLGVQGDVSNPADLDRLYATISKQ